MDGSIKPGNLDRGWNDPPMFDYKTNGQALPRQNQLSKRVAPPKSETKSQSSEIKTTWMASGKSTNEDVSAPPVATPLKADDAPPTTQHIACQSSEENNKEEDLNGTLERLQTVLSECESKLQKRIFDDITKRLVILRSKWDCTSYPVKAEMSQLSHALMNFQYEEAFRIHLSLMVNHVTEVSQWMVGIKRLIHEAKTIRPKVDESDDVTSTKDDTTQFQLFDTKSLRNVEPIKTAIETNRPEAVDS